MVKQEAIVLDGDFTQQLNSRARGIRSKYSAILNRISEGKDEIGSVDSQKFKEIMSDIENSHNGVRKPREQVADARALLDLTKTLVASVRSHSTDSVTPYMFICSLLQSFGVPRAKGHSNSLLWKDVGIAVSPVFRSVTGFSTMIGPMNSEVKTRTYTRRQRTKLYLRARPKELDVSTDEKTDTDKNISIMFQILKKKKRVKLENLIMNRQSFAQSIENLFALSFLVKDGRVVIDMEENGAHFVSPRNGPGASLIISGEVKYNHFVFRLDFADWELMKKVVAEGEELMPKRDIAGITEAKPVVIDDSQRIFPATQIKTYSNGSKVLPEASAVYESPDANISSGSLKRKLL